MSESYPERFPTGYMDIGNKSFEWVFENKKEFVDFTLNDMCNPTGLFKQWQDYCRKISKKDHGTSRAKSTNKSP